MARDDYAGLTQVSAVTAAAPAAAAVLATIAAAGLRAGEYEISGELVVSGTGAEILPLNAQLKLNGANFLGLPTAGQANAVTRSRFLVPRIRLDGTNPVQVIVVANATAATVYTANLVVTQLA